MQIEQDNISTHTNEETENSRSTISQSSILENSFQPKKVIAKLKKTKSKQYKKKVLYITSQVPRQFLFHHKFLIFGGQEIETFYQDFNSKYDNNLIMMSNFHTKVLQVERKSYDQCLQIVMENVGSSGLKDFQFLIDHFKKSTDQNYHQLAEQLDQYQTLTNECVKNLTDINKKVKSRIISEEEVQKAHEDYEQYFKNYIKQNYKDSDFYTYVIIYFDHESLDIQQKYAGLSFSVLSLLGLEPSEIEQKFMRSNISFSQLLGSQRLQSTIRNLFVYNNDLTKYSYEQKIITADCLEFNTIQNIEVVQWPDCPDWMGKYYMVGLVSKMDVSLNQLKSIIEMRSNQTTENIHLQRQDFVQQFEYTVQSEIFLEKFYPELFKNPETKRSLTLKKPNSQEIQEES